MDVKVCMESKDCPYTITFYGALFGEVHTVPHICTYPTYNMSQV